VYTQRIFIVNSVDVAVELFEKRSNIYSDRAQAAMIDLFVRLLLTEGVYLLNYNIEWAGSLILVSCLTATNGENSDEFFSNCTNLMLPWPIDRPRSRRSTTCSMGF